MPKIGDIEKAKDIGLAGYSKYIWNECSICGVERWVMIRLGKPYTDTCHKCAMERKKGSRHRILKSESRKNYREPIGTFENPNLGDIRRGTELGWAFSSGWIIWAACAGCGKQRWQKYKITMGKPLYELCADCSNKNRRVFPRVAKGTVREPEIGDVRSAKQIGKNGSDTFMWHACERCGVTRWASVRDLHRRESKYCRRCATRIRFGRSNLEEGRLNKKGYVELYIPKDSFFRGTAQSQEGRCLEHRFVMAKHLGRNLSPFEKVHHKNGIRRDNRIENLELTIAGAHTTQHNKGYRDGYEKGLADGRTAQIAELQKEIKLLRLQIEENTTLTSEREKQVIFDSRN